MIIKRKECINARSAVSSSIGNVVLVQNILSLRNRSTQLALEERHRAQESKILGKLKIKGFYETVVDTSLSGIL